jgi:hypothetical protein
VSKDLEKKEKDSRFALEIEKFKKRVISVYKIRIMIF